MLSAAERSHPTSEVRGISWEDPMPEGQRPRGVTPRQRSGAAPRVPGCDRAGMAKRSYPTSEVRGRSQEDPIPEGQRPRGVTGRNSQEELPQSKVRGSGREYQTAMAQERPRGATLCPRSGVVAKRSYPTSEVRGGELSSGHRTGKGQFSFQSQRKAMPKNAQTTAQLHSSHVLAK